jgi:hypothetical protein
MVAVKFAIGKDRRTEQNGKKERKTTLVVDDIHHHHVTLVLFKRRPKNNLFPNTQACKNNHMQPRPFLCSVFFNPSTVRYKGTTVAQQGSMYPIYMHAILSNNEQNE